MKPKISFIILAAGQGSRMNSSTPKVLHEIAGKAMIDHVIDTILSYPNNEIICVIPNKDKLIKNHVQTNHKSIKFIEQKKQLGTADAVNSVFKSKKLKSDYTVILYGDTPFITYFTIFKLISNLKEGKDAMILSFFKEEKNNYGKLIIEDDQVTQIIEAIELEDSEEEYLLCNSGVMVFKTHILDEVIDKIENKNKKKEYYLTDAVEILNTENYIVGFEITYPDEVLGVNTPLELSYAEEVFQTNLTTKLMLNKVKILASMTSYFSANCQIEADVVIEPNCFIGNNVKIEKGARIKSFSYLEDCVIGEKSVIGPFAHLRGDAEIAKDCRIGNFVEVKKSKIGQASKAAHLSYIGDSKIGKNVNIGAGTITCNYNGLEKNKTEIDDNVFIGSNTALIAPIKIKKDSLIAAGSVITKDVNAKDLAIARAKQVNFAGKADINKRKKKK